MSIGVTIQPDISRDLEVEADFLHRSLFGSKAPEKLIGLYVLAHCELNDLTQTDADEIIAVSKVVHNGLDALGIEPWLRSKKQRHLLSRKLLLISYLAECDSEHPGFRTPATNGPIIGSLNLVIVVVKGMLRMIRGLIHKRVYGIS